MVKVVHVVMGNDYPAAVFDTLAAAEAYCENRRDLDKINNRRTFWRTYDFYLNNEQT